MPSTSQILMTYTWIEESDPSVSTERLLQMTADECKCDVADVCDALYKQSGTKNKRPAKTVMPLPPFIPAGRLKIECGPLHCWLMFVPDKPSPQIHIAQATVNDVLRQNFFEVIAERFNNPKP